MKSRDRWLLKNLAIGCLLVWLAGYVVLGVVVAGLQYSAEQETIKIRRSDQNARRTLGSRAPTLGGRTPAYPIGLTQFRSNIVVPLRCTGVVGFLLFVTCGPLGTWLNDVQLLFARNRRALVATLLLAASAGLLAAAQAIVHYNSSIVTEQRVFTYEELQKDRQQRTITNPPPHIDRQGRGYIVVGGDPSEQVSVRVTHDSVRGRVDLIRLIAGITGLLGIVYAFLAAGSRSATDVPVPVDHPDSGYYLYAGNDEQADETSPPSSGA